MQVTIKHSLKQDDAIARVKQLLQESKSKLAAHLSEVSEEWQGNVLHFGFTAQGQHIDGDLTVKDYIFELMAKLPFALRLFEGKIEQMIKDQAEKMLQ